MNNCYIDFEGKTIFHLQILTPHKVQHQIFDPKSNLVFWSNKWFNGEPILSVNRFSILQYGDKHLLEQACDVLMISKVRGEKDRFSYIYDLLDVKEDWKLQVFLLLLNRNIDTETLFSIKRQILECTNNKFEVMLWNYVVDAFSLPRILVITNQKKLQLTIPKDIEINYWILSDIKRIQSKKSPHQSIKELLYFYTLGFFSANYKTQQCNSKKKILHMLQRKISSAKEKRNLLDELEILICQMGPKSLPLIPKTLLTKSKRYILTDVLSRIPIEVYENFVQVLTEDKDIELDAIVDLSAELQKSTQLFKNRLSILERKYPTPIQWKYVSKMSIEPCLQSIYATFCLSLVTKIDADHIILLANNRYQPHNFELDREIHIFMKSANSICLHEKQNNILLSFQNRLIVYVKKHFESVFSSDQRKELSSFFHYIEWLLLIDKTWDEIQAYVMGIKRKYECLEYISQKSTTLGISVPILTIDSDHESIDDSIKYLDKQGDLHQRIMVLHRELISLGGKVCAPKPPYKNVRWIQLENSYKFQIGRRYHLQNLSQKAFLPLSIIPEGKLQEEDFLFWTRHLEQQVYWKEQFCKLEQHLSESDQKKLRQQWHNQYVDAQRVSDILQGYKQIIKKRRYKFIFFFFSFIVICVLLRVIYIIQ